MAGVRDRFSPLGVRPFSRLLGSYTVNELGDSIGIVALAILVYDRTEAVAPTAAFFIAAKFLPALIAPALTARLDQAALRRSLPGLYVVEALTFAALALVAAGRLPPAARARARPRRRCPRNHRPQPHARAGWPRCSSRPGC